MDTARRVVITGADGRIGRAVAPLLPLTWDVVRTDRAAGDGCEALDVEDIDACRAAFAGADAVVHLAADPSPDASWDDLHGPNVVAAHHVARAAADAGVRRLVMASSVQALGAVPDGVQVRPDDPPRPATLYGATKAWAEALCSWVASTSATSTVALRIGYFLEERPDPATASDLERRAWLSPRDAADLVRAAVEAAGLRFVVADGTSRNRHGRADLRRTEELLGYRPADDAWA